MEIQEIDELLDRYRAAEDRIAANLVELDDHPTYELMTSGVLTGITKLRVDEVVAASAGLWGGLDALRRTLERARAVRGSGRVGRDARLELEAILTRASVLVAVVDTPLAQRDLLQEASTEEHITIDQLIDTLRRDYEPLRDVVAAIDAVWRDMLPRLDAAEKSLAELDEELRPLGATEPSVSLARGRLQEGRRVVMDDPLALDPDAGPALDAAVADAALHVGHLREGHQALEADIARTDVLLANARALRARAAVARAEAIAKVSEPTGLVRVPSESAIEELTRRADEVRAGQDAPWQHVRAELDAWIGLAERLVQQLAEAAEANRAPLDQRDELRGLLSAYRAKAAAVGLIEQPALSDLVDDAHNELFTAPTDLSRAHALVAELGLATQGHQ